MIRCSNKYSRVTKLALLHTVIKCDTVMRIHDRTAHAHIMAAKWVNAMESSITGYRTWRICIVKLTAHLPWRWRSEEHHLNIMSLFYSRLLFHIYIKFLFRYLYYIFNTWLLPCAYSSEKSRKRNSHTQVKAFLLILLKWDNGELRVRGMAISTGSLSTPDYWAL